MSRSERIISMGILRVRMVASVVLNIINAPNPTEALSDFCVQVGEDFGNAVRAGDVHFARQLSDLAFDVICEVAAGEESGEEALRVGVFAADLVQLSSGLSDENPADGQV